MSPQDLFFINGSIRNFKIALFQLVSDFGPNYEANFIITYDEIKNATGRSRLATVVLEEYVGYLSNHGFSVNSDGSSTLYLSTSAGRVVLSGNESVELATSIRTFRTRAAMNGHVDDM
ncbi:MULTISPECIES: hypothetical protein [unclassified Providencia]|uniref:hypothetical protein n=1 Tax=Providencia TaxID=586 RepID=UPI0023499613|nr:MULTISPECIES: hypothetical protein [unclassified Providencia]EJD6506547.1 hypothetical protein [Providencia rettgeri]HEC8347539.1 hypothetical protein [Providencia rettgeri]